MIYTAKQFEGQGIRGHYALVAYYNEHCLPLIEPNRKYRMKVDDNWCAMFTSCVAHMCGADARNFPYEVSVAKQVEKCKQRGWFFDSNVKASVNDLAFFDWKGNGTFAHVGFVFAHDGGNIITIEGNHRGDVALRTLPENSPFFAGFARTPLQNKEQ